MTTFFNTTGATNPELSEYRKAAESQDEIIMDFFIGGVLTGYTPSEVWVQALRDCPLTSVRRSITNLTDAGKLVKTGIKTNGYYGRPEHIWVLAKQASDPRQMSLV